MAKRGRPKGSVNKSTMRKYNALVKKHGKATVDAEIRKAEKSLKSGRRRKPGRPKGSTNKKRGPGRPKGSTSKRRGKSKTFRAHGVTVTVKTR